MPAVPHGATHRGLEDTQTCMKMSRHAAGFQWSVLSHRQQECKVEHGVEDEQRLRQPRWTEREAWYLDSHTVVGHGDARVAVPAHVHGCVGTVVALPVQGATGRVYVIFGLLFYRDLIRGSWGRRIRQRFKKTVREKLAFLRERMAFGFFLSCNGPVLKYNLNVTAELLVLAPIAQLCLGQLTPQCGGEKKQHNNTSNKQNPHTSSSVDP